MEAELYYNHYYPVDRFCSSLHFFLGTFFFASPWYQAWMDTGKKGLNHVKSVFSLLCCPVGLVTKSCLTLCNPVACDPTRLLCHGVFSGKSTRVGCHFLLQGIFPTQGSNFISCVSCIAGGLFTTKPLRKPALFMVVKNWKQSSWPSPWDWISKLWYIHRME